MGVNDPIQGYTRKCLKYVCYDYDNQMVLHGYRILIMDGLTAAMKFHDKKTMQIPIINVLETQVWGFVFVL